MDFTGYRQIGDAAGPDHHPSLTSALDLIVSVSPPALRAGIVDRLVGGRSSEHPRRHHEHRRTWHRARQSGPRMTARRIHHAADLLIVEGHRRRPGGPGTISPETSGGRRAQAFSVPLRWRPADRRRRWEGWEAACPVRTCSRGEKCGHGHGDGDDCAGFSNSDGMRRHAYDAFAAATLQRLPGPRPVTRPRVSRAR